MAGKNGIETIISVTDGFSKNFILFEKKIHQIIAPVKKLEHSLKRLDRVSGFKALRENLSSLQRNSSTLLQSITNLGTGIGVIAGTTGIFVSKINKIALMGDSLAKTSKRLGLSVESLQKFNFVAERSGVPVDVMQKNMQKFSLTSMRASAGIKKEAAAFDAFHIKTKKINGDVKSTEELLVELSDKFAYGGYTATQKLYAAQEIFGEQGASMVNFLEQGPESIRAQMALVEKYGLMNKEQAEASEAYADAVTNMHWAFRGMAVVLGSQVIPVLTKTVEKFTELFAKNKNKFIESVMKVVNKLPNLVDAFLDRLPGFMDFFATLLGWIEQIVNFFGLAKTLGMIVVGSVFVPFVAIVSASVKSVWLLIKAISLLGFHIGKPLVGGMLKFIRSLFNAMSNERKLIRELKSCTVSVDKFSNATQKSTHWFKKLTSVASAGLLKIRNGTGKAVVKVKSLATTVKQAASSFSLMGRSAQKAVAKVNAAGTSSMKMIKKVAGSMLLLDTAGEFLARMTDKDKSKSSREKFDEFMGDLPILGGFWKFGRNMTTSNVEFEDHPDLDLTSGMLSDELDMSELFRTVTAKSANNTVHSTIDVNFNNVPKDTAIVRRGFDDPSMYGFSMSPAF